MANPNTRKNNPSPVVETQFGSLQGFISKSRDGREFYEYLGIPFAKPPIGELRFEPPQPPGKWEGVRDATRNGSVCLQIDSVRGKTAGSEDCLYLSVFVPKLTKNEKLLPVLVWIHGGMFVYGSAKMYRPDYFMDHDVIMVSTNYRLGALGFLNTGDEVIRGNMGLKDQTMALRWVQANIAAFGGDPERVTIFGESAGSASVHHHVLSPLSKGLFHRAIAQSGTALPKWGTRTNAAAQAKRYAKQMGCDSEDTKEIAKYLKEVDALKLVETSAIELKNPLRDPISVFNPTIEAVKDENAFITEHPRELLKKGEFNKIPMMTGVNSEEGFITTAALYRESLLKTISENYQEHLPHLLWQMGPVDQNKLKRLKEFYIGTENGDSPQDFQNWTNMFTDTGFGAPASKAISLQSQHATEHIYAYYYSYKGHFSLTDILLAISGKSNVMWEYARFFVPRWIKQKIFRIEPHHYGACHFDECALLFPLRDLQYFVKPGDKDYELSKKLVKAWVDFATIQDLKTLQFDEVPWLTANFEVEDGKPLKYMQIDTTPCVVDEPNAERNHFWNTLEL